MPDENGNYVCGEDFCECCGDCLACYGGDCSQHGCSRCAKDNDEESE